MGFCASARSNNKVNEDTATAEQIMPDEQSVVPDEQSVVNDQPSAFGDEPRNVDESRAEQVDGDAQGKASREEIHAANNEIDRLRDLVTHLEAELEAATHNGNVADADDTESVLRKGNCIVAVNGYNSTRNIA